MVSEEVSGTFFRINVTQWLGPNTPTMAAVPEVDITHVLGDPVCDCQELNFESGRPEQPRGPGQISCLKFPAHLLRCSQNIYTYEQLCRALRTRVHCRRRLRSKIGRGGRRFRVASHKMVEEGAAIAVRDRSHKSF